MQRSYESSCGTKRVTRYKVLAVVLLALVGVRGGYAMVTGTEVEVRRTTVPGVAASAVGTFDLTVTKALVWRSGQQKVAIPYATLSNFSYSDKLARHLGVFPAIAVGAVRRRERKHLFVFTWKDDAGVAQVLEVEVPKDMPRGLLEVLRARAPQACTPAGKDCGVDRSPDEAM